MAIQEIEFYVTEEEEEKYRQSEGGMYFVFQEAPLPHPKCRKYHISSDIESAQTIVNIVLPYLRDLRIYHKVVSTKRWLIRQTTGSHREQAGKFITIYMDATAGERNVIVEGLYQAFQKTDGIKPCNSWPTKRLGHNSPDDTRVFEKPVYRNRQGFFIWGGFICDPRE